MFRSYRYLGWNGCWTYEITDSDFGTVIVVLNEPEITVGIVEEYASRNLNVGKNVALLYMYQAEIEIGPGPPIANLLEEIIEYQDHCCPKFINNWAEIAVERDQYLDKIWAMK